MHFRINSYELSWYIYKYIFEYSLFCVLSDLEYIQYLNESIFLCRRRNHTTYKTNKNLLIRLFSLTQTNQLKKSTKVYLWTILGRRKKTIA